MSCDREKVFSSLVGQRERGNRPIRTRYLKDGARGIRQEVSHCGLMLIKYEMSVIKTNGRRVWNAKNLRGLCIGSQV